MVTLRDNEHWAKDDYLPLPWRVRMVAHAMANKDGHANLKPGQLAQMLGKANTRSNQSAISRAITDAKARGMIGEESCGQCLVVDHLEFRQGMGGRGCKYHGVEVVRQGVR